MLKSEKIHLVFPLGLGQRERTYLQKTIARYQLPLVVTSAPSFTYELVAFNLTSKILSDWKVRKALLVGLDHQRLLQRDFARDFYRADSFLSPSDPLVGGRLLGYPAASEFNRRVAEQLLDDAGWRRGKEGVRWRRGEKLRLSLVSNKEQSYRQALGTFLVAEWRALGVEVHFSQVPGAEFFGRTLKKADYGDMALLAWRYHVGTVPTTRFHTSAVPSFLNEFSGFNLSKWRSDRVDQLLEALDEDPDRYRRQLLMGRLVQAYFHDIPEVPLFFRTTSALRAKGVAGFQLWPHGVPESYASEFWQVTP
jgi:peptide/nickel transport system substrate-binding protein